MRVVEITDPDELEALQPQWCALLDAAPAASPFQSPAWLIAWGRAFLEAGLWTLALWDGARLAALAPFYVHRTDDGRRQLTLLGNGISDRLDLIARPEARDAIAAAVFDHLGRTPGWDSCDFRDLPDGSPLLTGGLPGVALDLIEPEPPCPTLALDGAEPSLPEKRRRDLARCARRLAERGKVAYRTADAASLAADIAELIRLHGARWAVRGEPGVLDDPAVRAFHETATEHLLAEGRLRLDVLTLEGRPIAAHYGLRQGGRGYSYIHGYDPEFAAYAPSRLLIARVIEEACRDGLAEFDFLRGPEAYKYEWGARDRPQFRRRIVR
jgi:CelD/BcsL family acetyltransferase involved in cellulose biosynthesis